MSDLILEMKSISKVYPNGFVANRHVSFGLKSGEIHGLIGENGAGKSTLMKILFGEIPYEEGEIFYKGELLKNHTPLEAIAKGIGMVYQHFMLVPSLTVWENIFLGMEPSRFGYLDKKKALEILQEVLDKYKFSLNPHARIESLSVSSKQKVEILKSLIRGVKILILDEPTAVLTPQECVELFVQLKKIKEQGHSIIFISHKLKEVKEICSRITILKSGHSDGPYDVESINLQDISRLMVGREVEKSSNKKDSYIGSTVLDLTDVKLPSFDGTPINFKLKQGEILGIAGVEGNGQNELVDIITRSLHHYTGSIVFNGQEIQNLNLNLARKLGMRYIPEDRMAYGVALTASIAENVISCKFKEKPYSSKGILNNRAINQEAERIIAEYQVKCTGVQQEISDLSGGNIQKIIIGREFSDTPKLIIVNQPTRGIDIAAAEIVRKSMLTLKQRGVALLLISADLEELLMICDRIAVMYNGEIRAILHNESLSEEILGEYMLGIRVQEDEYELKK